MINVQNISSKLAIMPDAALKQFAEMHKDDPYTFSLALSESNRRKQLRSQPQQMIPQPKVIDKELEDMNIRKALPEDLGIAKLPINMDMPAGANGGIVAFGDGGDVPSYDKGGNIQDAGSNPRLAYRQYALNKASKMGLDPSLVDSIFQIESGYNPEAVSPKGAVGIGQLMPNTAAGQGVKDSTDPYQNIDASLRELKSLQKKYNNDTEKIAAAYNWGQGNLDKHLSKNDGDINPSKLPKETQSYIKKITDLIPLSSANAAPVASAAPAAPAEPQEVDRSITGQLSSIGQGIAGIPRAIGNAIAPEGAGGYAPGTRNFFERSADVVGIPEGFQREFSNTLNALPGASILRAPAAVGKLSAAAQAAREAEIASATAKAEAAAGKVANLRLPPLAASEQGIAAIPRSPAAPPVAPRQTFPLSPESVAMNEKVQAARQAQQLRNLEADKAAAEAASKGVTTAKNAAQTSEAMEMANAARAANMANKVISPANKAIAVARDVQAGRNLDTAADKVSFGAEDIPSDYKDETQGLLNRYPAPASSAVDDRTKRDPANYKPEEKKQIVEAAKEAVPPSENTEGWSNNDWLQFGLALMAGKSSNALTNVGEAGLSLLASKQARDLKNKELELYRQVHMEKPGEKERAIKRLMDENPKLSYAQALEQYTYLTGGATREDLAGTRAEAVKAGNYKTWLAAKEKLDASIVGIMGNRADASPANKQAYAKALAELGPNPLESTTSVASSVTPAVPPVKVVGVERTP